MSYGDDYETRRAERREEERRYQADVSYDVWRSGGDPDRVDRERVSDDFRDGVHRDDSASAALRRQRPPQQVEDFYEQQPEDIEEDPTHD